MDVHWLLFVKVSFWRLDSWQFEIGAQNILSLINEKILVTCELFDSPFQSIMLGDVGSVACGGVELRTLDVFRNGNKDIDVIGNTSLFVIAFDFNYKSDFCV